MARLRDVHHVLRTVGPLEFAKRVWRQGSDDQLMTWASALAYSWLFAVFPFFIFLMTLIPYLPTRTIDTAKREIRDMLYMLPRQGADAIWKQLEEQVFNHPPGSVWLRVAGLVLALWAASGGMLATMNALDRCYELKEGRSWLRQRLLALLLTVVVATMMLFVGLLLPIGGAVKSFVIRQDIPGLYEGAPWMVAFDVTRWVMAVLLLVSILTVLYHWGPAVRHRFQWLTPGAVFSLVVWVGLGLSFKYYLWQFANYNKTYGTIGGAVVLLLFFYIDAAVLLWGCEINSEIDFEVLKFKRGSRDFFAAPELKIADEPLTAVPAAQTTAAGAEASDPSRSS